MNQAGSGSFSHEHRTAEVLKRARQRQGDQPDRDPVALALHHAHLPRLDEAGSL
jgi:hypothetical protein